MTLIEHNKAIELEHIVRNLFKCDRGGVSGLADADNFDSHPMDAATMVVSYIYAKGLQVSETQFDDFLFKYDQVFRNPDEYDIAQEVRNYINELSEIVDQYS